LEQVRLLTNLETNESKLLQIMLVGQPELRGMLAEDKLRQLSQRITARFHLDPLSYDNTRQYIQHRLAVSGAHGPIFTSGAIARVHCYSKGIPRLINLICDRALLGAYTLGRIDVTPAIVNKAAREILAHPKPSLRVRPAIRILAASAVLTAAVIGIGGWGMVADAPHSWIAWWPTAASPPDETPPPAVAGGPGPASSRAGAADQSPAQPQAVAAAQEGHTPPTPAEPTAAVPVSAAAVDTAVPAAGLSAPQTADPQPVAIAAAPSGTPDPASQAAVPPPPAVEAAADAAPAASSPNAVDTATPPPSGEGLDSTALAASPPPPLANRLAELPAGPAWGDRILAGLWGVEAGKPGEHCQTAKSQGLRCFNFDGDWQTLLNLAHPALLELHLADGSQRSVPLLRLDQGQPVLDLAGTAVTVSSRDLLPLWRGKALIVWRPPAGYSGSMELGRRGADVRWLRQQLSVPAKAGQEDRYDAPLQNRVAAFQQQHGLQRDGSAGPLTLITLGAPMAAGPRLGTGPISPQN
jgi:general secretion pathway protein A